MHICCGPCAIYPVEALRQAGYKIEGFFYNPNIHPFSEYMRRMEAVELVSRHLDINVHYRHYDFENLLKRMVILPERVSQHCLCWQVRLNELVNFCKSRGMAYCTTTLLSSPYQDIELIKSLGDDAAKKAGITFLPMDFRKGFAHSHKISKQLGVYHQNYCGCLFSEKEAIEQRRARKQKPA